MRIEIRLGGDGGDMKIRMTATQDGERAVIDMLSRRKWELADTWNGYASERYLEFRPVVEPPWKPPEVNHA